MDSQRNRREFLVGGGSLALGAVTAGSLTGSGAATALADDSAQTDGDRAAAGPVIRSAGFGWEVTDLHDNGADAYFKVVRAMTLRTLDIDVAYMITSLPASPGFAEVLCMAAVSRGGPPTFSGPPQAYIVLPASPDFGATQFDNPNGLSVVADGQPQQDRLMAIILKTWVPADGTAATTYRNVHLTPSITLNAGDYLAFHMDHAGVGGDCEMQVVMGYS